MSEYAISTEDAMARLVVIEDYDAGNGPGPHVHTLRSGVMMLLGAHWSVEKAREAFEKYGAQEAGGAAQAMGHGIVVTDDVGPVFFEATPVA